MRNVKSRIHNNSINSTIYNPYSLLMSCLIKIIFNIKEIIEQTALDLSMDDSLSDDYFPTERVDISLVRNFKGK